MFAYSPTVNDRSGEIQAAGQIQGSQALAQGLGAGLQSAASGISGAIDKISGLKLQAAQTDATAGIAHQMGFIDADALATIKATPWQDKINLGPSLIQLVGQKTLGDRFAMTYGLNQQRVDQAASTASTKATPLSLY